MNIAFDPSLVVEDDPNVLELPEVTPCFKGYPVIPARNGQAAREQVNPDSIRPQAEIQAECNQAPQIPDDLMHNQA